MLLVGVVAAGCGQAPPAAKVKKVEVIVTTPVQDDVLDYQDFTGRIQAYYTADIKARVTGYIVRVPFKEGDPIKEGELLVEIDPRPYKAQLDQDKADLVSKKAVVVKTEAVYKRSLALVRSGASTQEDVDVQRGDWEVAKSAVGQATAKLEASQLNLDFCRVISPIDGRISNRKVDPGNTVKADETVLTTVVDDSKVYAYFDVDERTYLDLVGEKPSPTSSARLKSLNLPVLVRLANAEEYTHIGQVDFLDVQVNGNTGTIRMRAIVPNPRGTLKSGLFIRARLPVGEQYKALLIPDEAIQSDQGRRYVFVVKTVTQAKDDGTEETKEVVEYRLVTPGQPVQGLRAIGALKREPDGSIAEGLEPGDRVIISGMQRVRAGTVVHAEFQKPPQPPGSPLLKRLKQKPVAKDDKVAR
jgi:RND family efflux transporter MFP subunit